MLDDGNAIIKMLNDLDLSPEESVYALVFGLEDEISLKGKDAVFSELSFQREKMLEHITVLVRETRCGQFYWRVLRQAMGCETFDDEHVRKTAPSEAISYFRYGQQSYFVQEPNSYLRYILADCKEAWRDKEKIALPAAENNSGSCSNVDTVGTTSISFNTEELYMKVEQLMAEVRFYDQRRDQALRAIETLLTEIRDKNNRPENSSTVVNLDVPQDYEDNPNSVKQIRWPYRISHILQSFDLQTVPQLVKLLANFDNSGNNRTVTLWEQSVMIAMMRREGLWPDKDDTVEVCLDDPVESALENVLKDESTVRLANCLKRRGLNTVSDLMSVFAHGFASGWCRLSQTRQFGSRSMKQLEVAIKRWAILIPVDLCFPSNRSEVLALDFDEDESDTLRAYRIETIGRLKVACEDENRFSGLRYTDPELYQAAVSHLQKYGLWPEA